MGEEVSGESNFFENGASEIQDATETTDQLLGQ
jgi:hypothetical protein